MKHQKGSQLLRKGRTSIKNQHYLITTTVHKRRQVLNRPETAQIILSSLHWLESQKRIILDAAIIMPDHLHLVIALRKDSLDRLMHSLKSYTAKKINAFLKTEKQERPLFPSFGIEDPVFKGFDTAEFLDSFLEFYNTKHIRIEEVEISQKNGVVQDVAVRFK